MGWTVVLFACCFVLAILFMCWAVNIGNGPNNPKPNEPYAGLLWQLPERFKIVEVVNRTSAYVQDTKTGLYFFVHLSSNSYGSFLSYTHVPWPQA